MQVFILNTKDNLRKFDAKSDQAIFLGYSSTSKAYRVYNLRMNSMEESIHVKFNEYPKSKEIREYEEEKILESSKRLAKLEIQKCVGEGSSMPQSQNHEKPLDWGDLEKLSKSYQ